MLTGNAPHVTLRGAASESGEEETPAAEVPAEGQTEAGEETPAVDPAVASWLEQHDGDADAALAALVKERENAQSLIGTQGNKLGELQRQFDQLQGYVEGLGNQQETPDLPLVNDETVEGLESLYEQQGARGMMGWVWPGGRPGHPPERARDRHGSGDRDAGSRHVAVHDHADARRAQGRPTARRSSGWRTSSSRGSRQSLPVAPRTARPSRSRLARARTSAPATSSATPRRASRSSSRRSRRRAHPGRRSGRVAFAAHTAGDQLLIVGNASAQGATLGTRKVTKRVAQFNYTMIQRNPYGFTRSLMASKLYGGPEPMKERKKKATEHKRAIEYTLFWGARALDTSGSSRTVRPAACTSSSRPT
jgi:hypothetical protein